MALVDIDIEDYLDEVDTKYLIKELRIRKEKGTLKGDADDIFHVLEAWEKWPDITNVLEQRKQEWVIENWERIEP